MLDFMPENEDTITELDVSYILEGKQLANQIRLPSVRYYVITHLVVKTLRKAKYN